MLNKCQRAYSANARKLILLMPQRHTNISFLFKTTRKNENSIKQNEHAKTNWLNIFTYIKSETQHYGFFFLHYFQRIDTQLYRTGIGGWGGKSSLAAIGNVKTKVEKQSSLTFFPVCSASYYSPCSIKTCNSMYKLMMMNTFYE